MHPTIVLMKTEETVNRKYLLLQLHQFLLQCPSHEEEMTMVNVPPDHQLTRSLQCSCNYCSVLLQLLLVVVISDNI